MKGKVDFLGFELNSSEPELKLQSFFPDALMIMLACCLETKQIGFNFNMKTKSKSLLPLCYQYFVTLFFSTIVHQTFNASDIHLRLNIIC